MIYDLGGLSALDKIVMASKSGLLHKVVEVMAFRSLVALALLMAALTSFSRGADAPVPKEDGTVLADRVLRIFEAKCLDCHAADMPKPKGKFGYVLDLQRVADNPDFVVRGNAGESEIYQMVKNNEMPGEDADVPPLTDEEKRIVHDWIMAGAPAPKAQPKEAQPAPEVAAVAEKSFGKKLLIWFGKFHAASTHFPIALLLAAFLAEGIAWALKQHSWLLIVRFLTIIGAASAVLTATLGWCNGYFSSYANGPSAWIYNWHRWLGTITAVWSVVCAVLICLAECEEGSIERRRFRGALILGSVLISIVGFLGGSLVFGIDHYKW